MKFKVTYDHGFSTHDEIIEADSLEEAKRLADLQSVYKNFLISPLEDEASPSGRRVP